VGEATSNPRDTPRTASHSRTKRVANNGDGLSQDSATAVFWRLGPIPLSAGSQARGEQSFAAAVRGNPAVPSGLAYRQTMNPHREDGSPMKIDYVQLQEEISEIIAKPQLTMDDLRLIEGLRDRMLATAA
jgi:hypothetical protein